jgi:hypothetical protein
LGVGYKIGWLRYKEKSRTAGFEGEFEFEFEED